MSRALEILSKVTESLPLPTEVLASKLGNSVHQYSKDFITYNNKYARFDGVNVFIGHLPKDFDFNKDYDILDKDETKYSRSDLGSMIDDITK